MPVKLDDDKIKYVIREKEKWTPNATIAESMKISGMYDVFGPSTRVPARCRRSAVEAGLPPRQYRMRKSRWCWSSAGEAVQGWDGSPRH